jgi:hypothetical protein
VDFRRHLACSDSPFRWSLSVQSFPHPLTVRSSGYWSDPRERRKRYVRAGRTHRLAHPSAGSDPYRHSRLWLGPRDGGPIEEIRPGDVVWFAPGEKHWHGARPSAALTHIAIQEHLDGKVVKWTEKVSDDQYRR